MKRLLITATILLVILTTISASTICFSDRLSFGINEGHTRRLKDSVELRTSMLIDNRIGAVLPLSERFSLTPFALVRFISKTIEAPPISFYMHLDVGAGCAVSFLMNDRLSLLASAYTGTGKYYSTHTYLSFAGATVGFEYQIKENFYIYPELQIERASYQDSFALLFGAGVRL